MESVGPFSLENVPDPPRRPYLDERFDLPENMELDDVLTRLLEPEDGSKEFWGDSEEPEEG